MIEIYTRGHKYFDKKKVKYTHILNLLYIHFGINGKSSKFPLKDLRLFLIHLELIENAEFL